MNTEQRLLGKRIWSRPWFIVLSVLVLIVALFVFFRLSQKFALDKKLDEIRAAGYPATCAELDAWYSIPAGAENAADTILEAIALIHEPQGGTIALPFVDHRASPLKRTESMGEPVKKLATAYLADNERALELLQKAAKIKHSRYPEDLSTGWDVSISYFNDLRMSAQLLTLEAHLHAQNNNVDSTIDSIEALFGVKRSLDKEPILISQLVRIACERLAVHSLKHAVNQVVFSDEQLKRLSRMLDDAQNPNGLKKAFVGERCFGIDMFSRPVRQQIRLIGSGRISAPVYMYFYSLIGLTDQNEAIYLDIMARYIEAAGLPTNKRREATQAVDADLQRISEKYTLVRMIMPAMGRAILLDCEMIAYRDIARVALAVERFRLANGNLPDLLDDLVPKFIDNVPNDPFDGKPLKYKKLGPGFVIYSIGEDQQDDGGEERESGTTEPWDVTFIIER